MTDFASLNVLVTGASRGIGAATARAFAREGARVVLLARDRARIETLADELGENALATACDVADWPGVSRAVASATAKFGPPRVLVNNAGTIEPIAPIAISDPGGWGQAIDVNLKGVYHLTRACLAPMLAAGGGTVINVGSGAAHTPLEGWSAYCAAKAGVHMFTRCLHQEEGGRGIRAMTLSPGTVATDMQRRIKASGINPVAALDWADHIPPEWVARAMLWMCTPDADEFRGGEVTLRDPRIRERAGVAS